MAKPPSKKRNALELWSLDGPLAEALRSGGFKIDGPAYAVASMDTCLQGEGVHVRFVDGARVYSQRDCEFATLSLSDGVLVLRFAAPAQKDSLKGVEQLYREVPGRPGWLEFRRPATRDSKPALAARLGSILGQASFERNAK